MFNFKPLSSFFKQSSTEENKEKKEEKKEENDQGGDQGNNEDDAGDDQGDDQENAGDETNENATNASSFGKEVMISITQKEYKAFVSAQTELEKFGKNAQDRNNLLRDATQLQVWYQAAVVAGATSNSDANAHEKNQKKMSKVTADAKAAYNKSVAENKR